MFRERGSTKKMYEDFGDIDGVHNIHDDIIVAGANEKGHDKIVHRFMKQAEERGMKYQICGQLRHRQAIGSRPGQDRSHYQHANPWW